MKPDEEERLKEYFWKLEGMIPNPPRGWEQNMLPCKWAKILKERQESQGGARR